MLLVLPVIIRQLCQPCPLIILRPTQRLHIKEQNISPFCQTWFEPRRILLLRLLNLHLWFQNSYQPIYSPQGHRLSSRLSTSNAFPANVSSSPSGVGSSSLFPPPPPPSPPKSLVNNDHNSSSLWRESDATYATAIPASCRPSRLPPPSAQDLLSRRSVIC